LTGNLRLGRFPGEILTFRLNKEWERPRAANGRAWLPNAVKHPFQSATAARLQPCGQVGGLVNSGESSMTAPCMAAPTALLCFSRSTLLTDQSTATAYGAGTHAAPAASPRSWLSRIRSARLIHFAALCLLLLFGWTSSANAVCESVGTVTCSSGIPCKEIWFFNNSNQTLHPLLFIGRRGVDEWLQAYSQKSPAERGTALWATTQDSRVYINGKTGIAPKDLANGHPGCAKIQLPLYTALLPFNDLLAGRTDSAVDWWNGGRVEIFDDGDIVGKQYDIDVALKPPEGVLKPANLSGNPVVKCVEGDCKELKMVQRGKSGGDFDNSASYQLTEFTFGSAQTGKDFATTPFGWVPRDVGYNLSMVDSTYLPAAMEPLNNPVIPYIGSVMAPADFRAKMQAWLKAHDGYPIYKTSTLARPKIPQSFDVFAAAFFQFKDTFNTSANLNFNPNNNNDKNFIPGKPILDMINLYLKCKDASSADPTTTCGKIYNLKHNLFDPNLTKYKTYPCAVFEDPVGSGKIYPFPDTVAWRLWTLYGWVPYNFNFVASKPCGNKDSTPPFTGNALFDSVAGKDDKEKQANYQKLADTYRLNTADNNTRGLQYNYLTETTDKTQWFNPYVELLHSDQYLNLGVYAFSIDDAVGFQQHKGEGLIYAVGSTTGLQNTNLLNPNEIVNVAYGYATNGSTYLWQSSKYQCGSDQAQTVDLTEFPSFDFFPKTSGDYPCKVTGTNNNPDQNNNTKSFGITTGPPTLTIDCSSKYANDADWCSRISVIGNDRTPLHRDHIIGPSVPKK
jgi:hypothetical protein